MHILKPFCPLRSSSKSALFLISFAVFSLPCSAAQKEDARPHASLLANASMRESRPVAKFPENAFRPPVTQGEKYFRNASGQNPVNRRAVRGKNIKVWVKTGRNALHHATEKGDAVEVDQLIEHGLDIFNKDKEGNTPLHIAYRMKNMKVLRQLVAAGANPLVRNNKGICVLYLACAAGKLDDVRFLYPKDHFEKQKGEYLGLSPLFVSCEKGYHELVQYLLTVPKGVGIGDRDRFGRTPLFIACEKGHVEVVSLLLGGLDVYIRDFFFYDHEGRTPFFVACECGYLEIVKLFLQKRSSFLKLGQPDHKGRTCVSVASNPEIVQMLSEDTRFSHLFS